MSLVVNEYSEYIFGQADDRKRLSIQHEAFKPNFGQKINLLLDEYGLGERLEKAKASGEKVRILDIGTGQGFYLRDVAAILEERGWLAAAEFYALDSDEASLLKAKELSSHLSSQVHFYLHDVTRPLETCEELQNSINGPLQFDFIMAVMVMEHLPNARQQIERYFNALKPGGVFFLRDTVTTMNEDGWKAVHPVIEPFAQPGFKYIASINGGTDVARLTADWLRSAGASQVQAYLDKMPIGGDTETGKLMLQNIILGVINAAPALIKLGFATQQQFEATMATLTLELGPHLTGQMSFMDTLARKAK
ncbi:MAG TPA: class I SAM-dependent methyltransferase [Chloroflexia bacterium]|nr:class I SAM-dependent methyltransferase [Chloroflexia bacterium]